MRLLPITFALVTATACAAVGCAATSSGGAADPETTPDAAPGSSSSSGGSSGAGANDAGDAAPEAGGNCAAPVCNAPPCTAARIAGIQTRTRALAAFGGALYVASDTGGGSVMRSLHRVSNGKLDVLVPALAADGLTADASSLYTVTQIVVGGGTFSQRLEARALAAPTESTVLLDKQSIPWNVVVANGGELFFPAARQDSKNDTYDITALPAGGGAPRVLVKDQYHVLGLAADATDVVFSSSRDLRRVPRAGGTPTTIVTTEPLVDVALRGASVLAIHDRVGLFRVSKAGGTEEKLVAGAFYRLAVDGDVVYLGDADGVQCIRLAP